MMGRRGPIEERFERQYIPEPNTGCWLWIGSTTMFGHGQIRSGVGGRERLLAHRLSWELHRGAIPEGRLVLHECDNPPCVNPDHLSLGSYSRNTKDAYRRGRIEPTRGSDLPP